MNIKSPLKALFDCALAVVALFGPKAHAAPEPIDELELLRMKASIMRQLNSLPGATCGGAPCKTTALPASKPKPFVRTSGRYGVSLGPNDKSEAGRQCWSVMTYEAGSPQATDPAFRAGFLNGVVLGVHGLRESRSFPYGYCEHPQG